MTTRPAARYVRQALIAPVWALGVVAGFLAALAGWTLARFRLVAAALVDGFAYGTGGHPTRDHVDRVVAAFAVIVLVAVVALGVSWVV